MSFGMHSMAVVHRVVKHRKRAGARLRGNAYRRVVSLEATETHEQEYHFTKGKRSRAKRNYAVQVRK